MNNELLISIVNPVIYVPIRLYNCRFPSTFVVSALQINSFLTNKANFGKAQMNVNKVLTEDYGNKTLGERGKNKANSKPNKANLQNAQMNVSLVKTRNYENKSNWALFENKANFKPKQTQTKPISPPHAANQTQSRNPRRKKFAPPVDESCIGGNNTRANQGFRVVCVLQELHKMKIVKPQTEYA